MPIYNNDISDYVINLSESDAKSRADQRLNYNRFVAVPTINGWGGSVYLSQQGKLVMVTGRIIYPFDGAVTDPFLIPLGWRPVVETFLAGVVTSFGAVLQLIAAPNGQVGVWSATSGSTRGTIVPLSGFWTVT